MANVRMFSMFSCIGCLFMLDQYHAIERHLMRCVAMHQYHVYMCYFYFILLISLSMSETNLKPCIVFWQTVLYQNVALLLVSLHPLLTTIYCEIEIRAHKPWLPALTALKECYQFFSKRCTLYLLPEHVKTLYWFHVCCFVYWMEIM